MKLKEWLIVSYALVTLIWAIMMIVLVPVLAIWAINLLFNLAIPYTFETWCAATIIKIFLQMNVTISEKK